MKDWEVAFNAQWKPGPEAAAGMHQVGPDMATLVIYLDPDSLALMPPADPAKWPAFVGLLRQLRDGAQAVADFLEEHRRLAIEQETGVSLELPGLTY
ncbi:hypothetical protein AB5J62_02690 [Amycolatopsis sp. cg5]|uniref:hypothetical protein n=1 Tax=Amycolatopsis sp. cg5 TaxID=3238802 RepID=UPI00352350F6